MYEYERVRCQKPKARVSIRLTAPYSENRRMKARDQIKQMNADKSP